MKQRFLVVSVLLSLVARGCLCQTAASQRSDKDAVQSIPTQTVDLSGGKSLIDMPDPTVMGEPIVCSADGTAFIDVYASSSAPGVSATPTLFSIDETGTVKHLARTLPSKFSSWTILSNFANPDSLVSLVSAVEPENSGTSASAVRRKFFILRLRPGDISPNLTPLTLSIEPSKVGSFGNGDFIILGLDNENRLPVLALLNSDGSLKRRLDINQHDYGVMSAGGGNTKEMVQTLTSASFVPYGNSVLLSQPNTDLPLRVLSASGDVTRITLRKLPGYVFHGVFNSEGKGPPLVRLESETDARLFAERRVLENPKQSVVEFDPGTGDALSILSIKGPSPAEVLCAASGRLTSLTSPDAQSDASTAAAHPLFASAPYR